MNPIYSENPTYNQTIAHLERELELSGLETDEKLLFPTMVLTTTVNKKHNHKTQNSNKSFADVEGNLDMSLKNVGNTFEKSKNDK